MGGQLHVVVALPLEKEPHVPIEYEAEWASASLYIVE
jgi:hypothetical protein